MKKVLKILALFSLIAVDYALADDLPNIDRTDKVSSRRYLDSLNAYDRRPIRINQSGFRPQDYKYAYVADPKATTFSVINANSGAEAWSGSLSLITAAAVKPNIWINGAFNSTASVYEFGSKDSTNTGTEALYRADFTGLSPSTPGEYFVVVGDDTSATFHIHPSVFNAILENSLQFFGIQRCGNTNSHFHGACHLKDGSAVGHDLTGGWHDCGDHFKVSETFGYSAYVLSMVYLTYQDKAEDRYGDSYADTTFTDGIPDILHEAKIGTDLILKLYNASKADGLIEQADMYHSVGVADGDHAYWDLPERQDAQSPAKGGPDRDVSAGIGANTSGIFVAALANVAVGYQVYDPAYSDSLLAAAKDIYANVFMPAYEEQRNTSGNYYNQFYTGAGPLYDDGAAAALALWYATKDTTYQYDLYKNTDIFNNESNYRYNLDYFKAGFLGNTSGFTPGGWATDYQNIHSYVLFAFQKMILNDAEVAASYGLSEIERDSLSMRVMASFRKVIDNSTNEGDSLVLQNSGVSGDPHEGTTNLHVITPYNLVWTSFDWGVMRYNMGTAVSIFLMYELTGDERYLKVALDNMYFILGANPWDMSFLMGAGEKNSQHPHNRSANPDGYNAGGMPYDYKCPVGALMGAREPTKTLLEDWSDYTATETCIDFSAQFLFPAQSLAQSLPVDSDGPVFSNIAGTPISDTSAVISWDSDETALVTVFYSTSADFSDVKSVTQDKSSKGGSITITGLVSGQTYYFFLEGMDTKRNITTDDNHGYYYNFTMTTTTTNISGVTICQVDNRSAIIYWWTSDRMNGVVNYGTNSAELSETQSSSDGAVLFHEAKLTNLQAGTTYYFSVSSGATTDNNGGNLYSFTTELYSTTVDMDIYMKPLNKDGCASSSDWRDCNTFLVIVTNRDTIAYEDLDLRFYFPVAVTGLSYNNSIWDGTGQSVGMPTMTFDSPVAYSVTSASGNLETGYYTEVHIEGNLAVSGSYFFEFRVSPSYGELENSWSLRPHTDEDDPEQFAGIDLTKGPLYTQESNSTMYVETINGVSEVAFTRTPYVTAYYHGNYIYGYAPDYSAENGPQVSRTVTLTFESPFVSPEYSLEQTEYSAVYSGSSTVSPTGYLDDLEMNGNTQPFVHDVSNRYDSFIFYKDTVLAYGNNYMEWVSWHNHGANSKTESKYDCACAVVRSNVEVDSITTPREKRYLVFDKTSYSTYVTTGTNPKMAEVHVGLYDSAGVLLDTVNVTISLQTADGNPLFWSSATSTIPITSITLVNGEATFYVSSEAVLTTTLNAVASSSTTFEYISASAELIVEELPPWPIIDVAVMLDRDCDNIPDALQITISSEYLENQSFNSVVYVYGSDTITTTTLLSHEEKELIVAVTPRDTSINTNPTGSLTLVTNVDASTESHTDFYQDGISPTVLSISVLERLDTATSDRVYIQFSEPISAPSGWPLKLYASDGSTQTSDPVVKFAQISNDSLNIWEFEIAFADDGSSLVTEGMFGELLSNGGITDINGNTVSEVCEQPKIPISLKLIPVPMTYAAISDLDEDGIAEHIDIEFERAMDDKHIPDNFSIIFGSSEPETLWIAGTEAVLASDKMSATIDAKNPFSLGVTSGTYSGSSNGTAIDGAGLVTEHIGTDASYTSSEVLAEDKVGPVIVSASMYSTTSSDLEFLTISLSEETTLKESNLVLYRQKQDSRDTAIYKANLSTWDMSSAGLTMISGYSSGSDLAVNDGDYVRLEPKELSAIVDKKGNQPSLNNPWVAISGKGKPIIAFNIKLGDQISNSGGDSRAIEIEGKNTRFYVYNTTTKKLDLIENGVATATQLDSTDLNGAVWRIELNVPRGATSSEDAAWDTLTFKYNIPIYSNLGSYVNRFHGKFKVLPNQYYSSAGKIIFYAEWANLPTTGIQASNGRAVGSGAYIYKAQFDYKFSPNASKDTETIQRFTYSGDYDKTETFGIKKVK